VKRLNPYPRARAALLRCATQGKPNDINITVYRAKRSEARKSSFALSAIALAKAGLSRPAMVGLDKWLSRLRSDLVGTTLGQARIFVKRNGTCPA